MIIETMVRRRATLNEPVRELNFKFVTAFVEIADFWKDGESVSGAKFDDSTGEGATLDLRKSLRDGLTGQISYIGRRPGYISDTGMSDDFLTIRLDTEKVNYVEFCSSTLPSLIQIFEPYRAAVQTDKSVRRADWKRICDQSREASRDIDGRDSVFRIWPTSFFDEVLCQRSFGIGAEEVVRRASLECERAEVVAGGAFLFVTSDLVVGSALDDLNARVMSRLAQ